MADPKTKKGLAGVVGAATALLLLVNVPREESGRKVAVTVSPQSGTATIRHISGPQYLKAYLDIVGVPTACDGITRGVRMGQTYTEAQCTAMLEAELAEHAKRVMACSVGLSIDHKGRDNVRFAAISLAYNVGTGAWCGSTARRLVDAGRIREACDAMTRFNRAGGRVVAGLTARRAREHAVCVMDA